MAEAMIMKAQCKAPLPDNNTEEEGESLNDSVVITYDKLNESDRDILVDNAELSAKSSSSSVQEIHVTNGVKFCPDMHENNNGNTNGSLKAQDTPHEAAKELAGSALHHLVAAIDCLTCDSDTQSYENHLATMEAATNNRRSQLP